MRILLILPKSNYPQQKPSFDIIPQGVGYLAGALKAAGHEVFGLNIDNQLCTEGAPAMLRRKLLRVVTDCQPQLIGVGGLSADYMFVRDTIAVARKIIPHIPIVCGGGIISSDVDFMVRLLRPDFAVLNEGEETIVELANCIENGERIGNVRGIAYMNEDDVVKTEYRKPIANLDNLPFPDYSSFDIESSFELCNQLDYYFHVRTRKHPRIIPVIAARSCPFNCTFCYHSSGKTYRQRSIDNVIEEIVHFYEKYNFNILKLYDELFAYDNERVRYFCQCIRELKIDIDWACALRVDHATRDLLRDMKDSGCIHIGFGFESAHQGVLDSMKKKITVEQIKKVITIGDEIGLGIQGNFIYGDIAETPQTAGETFEFYKKNCRDLIVHNDYITPYPGSAIFRYCVENGIISNKQKYYETIHLRPRINMTKMPYDEFRNVINPIVSNKYEGIKSCSVISCQTQDQHFRNNTSNLLGNKDIFVAVRCPHCGAEIEYIFPFNWNLRTLQGRLEALRPIVAFCAKCHKRFLIPTTELFGLKDTYNLFIRKVNSLAKDQKAAVFVPVLGEEVVNFHKAYGLAFDKFSSVCFMDVGNRLNDNIFMSYPVCSFNAREIQLRRDHEFIVLPCSEYKEIESVLRANRVSEERIHLCPMEKNKNLMNAEKNQLDTKSECTLDCKNRGNGVGSNGKNSLFFSNRFLATTPGLSATRWLSFALASRKDVFVSHGKHPLDSVIRGDFIREKGISDVESLTLGNKMAHFYAQKGVDEIFSAYREIMPRAAAYGNVHAFTIESLMKKIKSKEDLNGIKILNVLRHPISYIESHYRLVRSAEQYPDLYRHYEITMLNQAVKQFPELLLFDDISHSEFTAFAVSCLSICNLAQDFVYNQFRYVQMEELTSNVEVLQEFCEYLTGLEYSKRNLNKLIQQGPINRHKKKTSNREPWSIYESWVTWQQDIAHIMLSVEVIDKLEENGYDVSMLRMKTKRSGDTHQTPQHDIIGEMFFQGNYAQVALTGDKNRWETYAAFGLIGKAKEAIKGLSGFHNEQAHFYSAVASWIDGDEVKAIDNLKNIQTPHAQNLLALIRKPKINILAQLPWTRRAPHDLLTAAGKDKKFEVKNISFHPDDLCNEPYADIHKFYDSAKPPDFYVCTMVEWHLIAPNLQKLPCPIIGQTADYDLHIQAVYPWLQIFDEMIVTDQTEWEDVHRLVDSPVSTFPKSFGVSDKLAPVARGPKPVDVFLSGTMTHPYNPDKAALLHQLFQMPGIKTRCIEGFMNSDTYNLVMANSKVNYTYVRHPGSLPTRGIEALSMGCSLVVQRGSVLTLFAGEEEGVLTYDYKKGDLNSAINRILNQWLVFEQRARRGAEIIRCEFAMPKVASQYLRFLTFIAAKPRCPRKVKTTAQLDQKRTILSKGWLPGNVDVLQKIRVSNLGRWYSRKKQENSSRLIIDMARELVLGYALSEHKAADKKLLDQALTLYRDGLKRFPHSLVLRFNLIRVAIHFGHAKDISEALHIAEEILMIPEPRWNIDVMEDVFPWDFHNTFFNYRKYFDLVTEHLARGSLVKHTLTELILASLHHYLGDHLEKIDHLKQAVSLDPDFPYYKMSYALELLKRGRKEDFTEAGELLIQLAESSILFNEAFTLLEQFKAMGIFVSSKFEDIACKVNRARQSIRLHDSSKPFEVHPIKITQTATSVPQSVEPATKSSGLYAGINHNKAGNSILKKQYLVSALVPTYKAERFMRGLLEDLEAQTIADRLEIVIVDSNSPQNERAVVEEFQKQYDNIVYVRTDDWENSHAGINRCIRLAKGKYLTLACTDDRHKPDAFERMIAVLDTRPDIALVYANCHITMFENEKFENCTPVGAYQWVDFDPLKLLYGCYMGPQPMWRKNLHEKHGYLDESLEQAGDWDFWLRLAENETFLHINEFLGLYLYSPTGRQYREPRLTQREGRLVHKRYIHREAKLKNAAKRIQLEIPADSGTIVLIMRSAESNEQVARCVEHVQLFSPSSVDCSIRVVRAHSGIPENNLGVNVSPKNKTIIDSFNKDAIQEARYIVLLSPNVLVTKDWIDRLMVVADLDKDIAAIGPIFNEGPAQQRAIQNLGDSETELEEIADRFKEEYGNMWEEVSYLSDFCLMFKGEAVQKVGGLKNSHSLSASLQDLYLRLQAEGYKLACARGVYVHHPTLSHKEIAEFGDLTIRDKKLLEDEVLLHESSLQEVEEKYYKIQQSLSNGKKKEAKEALEMLLLANSEFALGHNDLGVLCYQNGDTAKALEHYKRAVELQPVNVTFLKNLADFYYVELGRIEDALKLYNSALYVNPKDTEILIIMGHICVSLKKFDDAKVFYIKVLEIDPLNEDARQMLDKLLNNKQAKNSGIQVSIILPTSGQQKYIKKCVDSIEEYTSQLYEIIFVDNGATKGTKKWIKQNINDNLKYQLVNCPKDVNLSGIYNEGIKASTGEYILLLSNDLVVTKGWLDGMLECLQSITDAGIVGPMSNVSRSLQKVSTAENVSTDQLDEFAESFMNKNRNRRISTFSIDGFCMLFSRNLVEEIGFFDEEFGQGGYEDEDFCLRALLEGRKNLIAGDVYVHKQNKKPFSRNKKYFNAKWNKADAQSPLGKKFLTLTAIEKGGDVCQRGHIDNAVEIFLEGIGLSPDDKRPYYALAEILLNAKNYKDAIDVLNEMPQDEQDARRLELIGYCKEGMKLYDEAQNYANQALSLNPSSAPALNLKGVLVYNQGDNSSAESFFNRAIESDPGYGEPYTNLGAILWDSQQEKAFDLFEKGFILSPTITDIVTNYHSAVTASGEFERADQVFKEASLLYPNNKIIRYQLIDVLIKQEKNAEAMHQIEEAIALYGVDDGILSAALKIRDLLGPKEIDGTKDKKYTVSLCMIVKNEEGYLARCLESVKPVVDEMIVIDTGSDDSTIEIAKAFGAKVYNFGWTDDFSEARNFSLSKASGNWTFHLDADEVISPIDYEAFRKITRQSATKKVAFLINTRNYTLDVNQIGWTANDGHYEKEESAIGWTPSEKVRLFRNESNIRFEYPIHELVETSLKRAGYELKKCKIPVHHYGKLNKEKSDGKREVYYQTGRKKLDETGGDAVAIRELAIQAEILGKHDEAIELWERFIVIEPNVAKAYINMGIAYCGLGKFEEVLETAIKAMKLEPDMKEAHYNYALGKLHLGSAGEAVSTLEKLFERLDEYPTARFLLAAAYCCDGKKDKGINELKELQKSSIGPALSIRCHELAKGLVSSHRHDYGIMLLEAAIESKNSNKEIDELYSKCLN